MAALTERISFQVPAETKAEWKAEAARRELSLSAFVRMVALDLIERQELEAACARLGLHGSGSSEC